MSTIGAKARRIDETIWLADTGASCHMTNNDEGMFDCKNISTPIRVGSGKTLMAIKIGKLKRTVVSKNGSSQVIVLQEVKYVPELWVNLFSVGQALKKG